MDVVTWLMYRQENAAALRREKQVRLFGKDTAHALVQRVATATGSDAGRQEPNGVARRLVGCWRWYLRRLFFLSRRSGRGRAGRRSLFRLRPTAW